MRRLLALLLLALTLLPLRPSEGAPGAAVSRTQGEGGAVVVVGVAGLRWSDVGPGTPTLEGLARTGAVGLLSVKALPGVTCAGDGWLTLGAGARAGALGQRRAPCGGGLGQGDGEERRANLDSRDGARLGELGRVLGDRVKGVGPGALAALSRPTFRPDTRAGAAVRVVDLGVLLTTRRAENLAGVDQRLAELLATVRAGTDVLVVGLSEPGVGPRDTSRAELHVALATGPHFPRGALRSGSTRRAPYVQLIDVAPTVLSLVGADVPDTMDGLPWTVSGDPPTVSTLVDLSDRAVDAKAATVPFFVVLIAGLLAAGLLLRRRPRALQLVGLTGTAALGASYAANLAPWWRTPAPLAALLGLTLGLSLVVALVAARTRHPVGVGAAFTALVVAADLVTGAHLQIDSVAGYSPLVAGRFAGLGNVAFGVYAAAVLLAVASYGPRALVLGLLAVGVDGAPPWGSDVGGVLALLPALVVLALLLTGRRVNVLRLALAGLGAATLVIAFALADLARPAGDRTHLGRFAAQVRDGTAGDVLERKASAVFGLLFHSPVTAALPLVVAAAVWLVLRPPDPLARAFAAVPELRHAFAALGVACALGFALNDSGAAVPALALLVTAPATVAAVAGVARSSTGTARL